MCHWLIISFDYNISNKELIHFFLRCYTILIKSFLSFDVFDMWKAGMTMRAQQLWIIKGICPSIKSQNVLPVFRYVITLWFPILQVRDVRHFVAPTRTSKIKVCCFSYSIIWCRILIKKISNGPKNVKYYATVNATK